MFSRRDLLKGIALTGGMSVIPLGHLGWALAAPEAASRHFIFIMMRGAVDGLSIVTPYMEQNYYRLRSNIALPPPGQSDGLINLDGFFGLHPSLASLMPLWMNNSMAFIQASGSPSETRSHFEAQDIMETAMLNSALATQGWMNGLAQVLPDNQSPTRALSIGNILPKVFQGKFNVATIPSGIGRSKNGGGMGTLNPHLESEFGALYSQHPELNGLYQQGVSARAALTQDMADQSMQDEMVAANKDAPPVDGFTQLAGRTGAMIKNDRSIQAMFMDVGGWDTHVGQGNAKGQLAGRLEKFGQGLAALAAGLGPAWRDTTILVMSEFGRTAAENGNKGTDHGHGNVAWLMGGSVHGGKIWGRWPGLDQQQLHEGRDLAVTTDFRSLIGGVLGSHFDLTDNRVAQIIPGYQPDIALRGIIG